MSTFKKPVTGRIFRSGCVAAFALAQLSACTGSQGTSPIPTDAGASSRSAARTQILTSADFKQIAAWGAKGKLAVVQCPQGYKVVAGGSSSSNGTSVGTGYADSNRTAWVVKPESGASAEAFATCIARMPSGEKFQWRSGGPVSGLAAAQCRVGYMIVTGYGTGTVTASWFDPDTNTYWVNGGGTAYASCVRNDAGVTIKHAWNHSQKPKAVFAGCGSNYTVIGGSMGNSAWPGPPIQEHPGVASAPSIHGYHGWWTFSNALNELTWAACVAT